MIFTGCCDKKSCTNVFINNYVEHFLMLYIQGQPATNMTSLCSYLKPLKFWVMEINEWKSKLIIKFKRGKEPLKM